MKVGVRPEHLSASAQGRFRIEVTVELVERLGETSYAYVRAGDQANIIVELKGREVPAMGDVIALSAADQDLHVFGSDGQRIALA